jgi:hypothetical protein
MRFCCHYCYENTADVSGYVASIFRVVPEGTGRKVGKTRQQKVPVPKIGSTSSLNHRGNLNSVRYENFYGSEEILFTSLAVPQHHALSYAATGFSEVFFTQFMPGNVTITFPQR